MKKLTAVLITLAVMLVFAGCSDSKLDSDGTKHITFINDMGVVVTSVTADVNGTQSDNLLSSGSQLKDSDRTMLKIPASSSGDLKSIGMTITDSTGTVYNFKELNIQNAGSLTFKNDDSGNPSLVISS